LCFLLRRLSRWCWPVIDAVVDASICRFHMDYIYWEYLFSIWIGSFKSRHFKLTTDIFLMSVRHVYAEFRTCKVATKMFQVMSYLRSIKKLLEMQRHCTDRSAYDIKVSGERFESIRLLMLLDRSRGTLILYTDRSAQRRCISNKPNVWIFCR